MTSSHKPHTVVVVSHTHWDREWYQPLGVMRHRLAALIDELLEEPDGLPFVLDGQAIVLDDYRLLRPERAQRLSAALSTGQLEAGPWYVLADTLMPSGEALVRNLLEGTRTVREAGGTPPAVLYSPDAFGHSAAGPVLADGFDLGVAIVWRGYGGPAHPVSTVARWSHDSGASVVLYHLPPDGYEIGASLPVDAALAEARWRAMHDPALGTNPLRVALVLNGADHHARQSHRAAAVAALMTAAAPHLVEPDSLGGFAARLTEAAIGVPLPSITGELRDSAGWTWSLQGTFATRAYQKRRNAGVERLLVRDAEPWVALAWFMRATTNDTLRTAWKTLLSAHPHDTLCGCSIDAVARAADVRWDEAESSGEAVRDDALRALTDCDASTQRELEQLWSPTIVLRNPAARARGGAVTLDLIDVIVADPVGPKSAGQIEVAAADDAQRPSAWTGADRLQVLRTVVAVDRVESPRHYPRNAIVRRTKAMAWIEPIPGYSVQPARLSELASVVHAVPDALRVAASEATMESDTWRVSTSAHGVVARHVAAGVSLHPLGWIESVTDVGDTYTPALRGPVTRAHWSAPTLAAAGPLRATWQHLSSLQRTSASALPATQIGTNSAVLGDEAHDVTVTMNATLSLTAGADQLDIMLRGQNTAADHRLRWVMRLPAGVRTDTHWADAAFGAVARTQPAISDSQPWSAEAALPTAPLHRWLHLQGDGFGIGIVSDGLAEYELLPDGHLAITLVRAVGELSRRDLPERPGHAGWPAPTPGAQCLGDFEARFSIVVLAADVDVARDALAAVADDVLCPIRADTWRGVATPLSAFDGLTLHGDGLVFSAAKRSEDGAWLVLRCVNQRANVADGHWTLPGPAYEVRISRLDEAPGDSLPLNGSQVRFTAPPFAVVTLLVR